MISSILNAYLLIILEDDIQEETEEKAEEKGEKEKENTAEEAKPNEKSDTGHKSSKRDLVKKLFKRQHVSKTKSDLKSVFKIQKYCVYTLCEHDEVRNFDFCNTVFLPFKTPHYC